ncbi:MAG: hypothetical protein EP307_14285 [Rhodobacteraceae bacterium]|nr:MAG: hypothetical protein EP307_14285 [Paracoccaceae bacterium]
MDRSLVQQLAVFAAIFLILQIGFDLWQGVAITPEVFLMRLAGALVATGVYGFLIRVFRKRNERGE